MVQDAVSACEAFLAPEVVAGLKSGLLDKARKMRTYYAALRQRRKPMDRRLFQLSQLIHRPGGGAFRGGWPVVRPAKMARHRPHGNTALARILRPPAAGPIGVPLIIRREAGQRSLGQRVNRWWQPR